MDGEWTFEWYWVLISLSGRSLTCTMLLSDSGLDEETPESDAQDFTDADRTIFGVVLSGDGEADDRFGLVVVVIREGHDEAVARR